MKQLMVTWILIHATLKGNTVNSHGTGKTTKVSLHSIHSKRTVVSYPVATPENDTDDENKDKAKHLIFDMSLAQIASKYNMKHLQDLIARTKIERTNGSKNEDTVAKVEVTAANSTAVDVSKNSTQLKNQFNSLTERENVNATTNSNSTANTTSPNEPKKELKEFSSPVIASNTTETTGTRRGDTTSDALCENCLNNCNGLVKSVTSLPDLSVLPLESKVLPDLLSCYYGNNNNNDNSSTNVEDLHTAALLDEGDEFGSHGAGSRNGSKDKEGADKRNMQERSILTSDEIGNIAESWKRKSTDTEASKRSTKTANHSPRSKSNHFIKKSIRSTIRSKSHIDNIQKKDSVNNANIIAALGPLKEREGYLNILSNVDALLKKPNIRKRGEGTDANGEEVKEQGEKITEDDNDIEKQKNDKDESRDRGVEDKDWDDLEKEENEKDNPHFTDEDRQKLKVEDVENEEKNAMHDEKGAKNTQNLLEKSHAKGYENNNKDDSSGSSLARSAPLAFHKSDEADKEDGTAFLKSQMTEGAEKRHNKAYHESRGRYLHADGSSASDEKSSLHSLEDQFLKKKSSTEEKDQHNSGIKRNSFRRQFPSTKGENSNENKQNTLHKDSAQTVTKESIARTDTGETNDNTNILTAQLNTQITDLENKLIQQKLAEELKQFTTEQNPPGTTGPSTSEILNFEKNLEKSFEYDPELRNLERGRGGRGHDYLVFNGGHTASEKGEKEVGMYDELRKSGDAIDKYEKETTAKLLKMYSPKLAKDLSASKFASDDFRSKSIDTDSSKPEDTDRIDLFEKDASKLIDRNPPNVASKILEKDRAQLSEAVGTSVSLDEGNGSSARLVESDEARAHGIHQIEPITKPSFIDNRAETEEHHGIIAGRVTNSVENALHREYISPNMNLQGHFGVRNHPEELLEQYTHPSDISNSLPGQIRMQDYHNVIDNSHRLLEKYTEPGENHGEDLSGNPNQDNEFGKERLNQNPTDDNQPMLDGNPAPGVVEKDFSDYTDNENEVDSATRKVEEPTGPSNMAGKIKESLSTATPGTPATSFAPKFSYDPNSPLGPDSWQRINRDWTCKGRKQSPIDIDTHSISSQQLIRNIMLRSTTRNTRNAITGVLKNNGHAPTVSLSSRSNGVKLFGGPLNGNYYLKQLHFHFGCNSSVGSEHRIDGKAYPVELHLVFWDNSTYSSFSEAAKSDRGVAVIAVLYTLASKSTGNEYPLSQILKILRHVENQGDSMQIYPEDDIRLEDLVPNLMSSDHAGKFYTYEGSLSSPGCYETVTWVVIASQPPVTEEQLQTFRTLKSSVSNRTQNMCNNFRPVQPTNGRKVFSNII